MSHTSFIKILKITGPKTNLWATPTHLTNLYSRREISVCYGFTGCCSVNFTSRHQVTVSNHWGFSAFVHSSSLMTAGLQFTLIPTHGWLLVGYHSESLATTRFPRRPSKYSIGTDRIEVMTSNNLCHFACLFVAAMRLTEPLSSSGQCFSRNVTIFSLKSCEFQGN
jgi:hypothetical protein